MAGRSIREEDDVSLFPFLSILACIIGVLTLMILGLALGQMDTGAVAQAEEFARVKKRLEPTREEVAKLRETVERRAAQSTQGQRELQEARQRLRALEMQVGELLEANKKPVEIEMPQLDDAARKKQLAALKDDLEKARERVEELLAELKKRKAPPEAARVQIRPSGSGGSDLVPTFVECNAQGLVIYEEDDKPYRVPTAAIRTDEKFLEHLQRVKDNPKASIIFLVRSDAIGVYHAARAVARKNYVRNGKLPVIGKGEIDLSLFRSKN
jgi:hypothetical protein